MISLDALYLELGKGMAWKRWEELRIWDPSRTMGGLEAQILSIQYIVGHVANEGQFTRPNYVYMNRPAEFYCWAEESGIWPQADLDRCLLLVTRDLNR